MNPLLEARQRRGLSQQDLAEITGYSRQMIQRYEAGRSNTPPVELCAFYDEADSLPLGTYATRFEEYIEERRARLPLSELRDIFITEHIPNVAMRKMRQAIEDNSDIRPALGHNASLSDAYFLSATLHIHPYSLQKWQQTGNTPTVIAEVIAEKFSRFKSMRAGEQEGISHGQVAQED